MTGTTDQGGLRCWVARAPLLRTRFDPTLHRGRFLISGRPEAWTAAAATLRAAGCRVLAFHDARWRSPRLLFHRRPVLHGRKLGPFAGAQVLFAGTPHKRYFSPSSPALERCLWHVAPKRWQENGPRDSGLFAKHGAALDSVFGALEDDESREVYASLVRGQLEGNTGYFRTSYYREYEHPIVHARPREVVIDAGAFTGRSALRFLWQMRGIGTVVALEPSAENYAKLARWKLPGMKPLCVGAWNATEVVHFDGAGPKGRIAGDGATQVSVTTIDRLVRELELPRVDLLKLDIEGAEAAALEGARDTLQRHRPKLQVSIYHHKADYVALPRMLAEELTDYRFYVGHHGFSHTETDLYAIPAERL